MVFYLIVTCILFWHILNRLTCGIAKSSSCLVGKTAIVTGGNVGIGYEVCLDLASRGCKVIMASRSESSETVKKIIRLTNNPNVFSKKLDLSSFKSIRNFVDEIKSSEEKLDILINNSGIGGSEIQMTEDGLNPVMQVNYFGPFLLTHLLLDLLKKSGSARIIFTSSYLAYLGYIKPETFLSTGISHTSLTALYYYSKSKVATIMASDMFARKLKKYGITSNSLHPGLIATNIYNTVELAVLTILFRLMVFIVGKSAWEGAQTTILLATSKEVENVTGKYFIDCRSFVKPFQTGNLKLCEKIWKISEECVKLTPEEKIS